MLLYVPHYHWRICYQVKSCDQLGKIDNDQCNTICFFLIGDQCNTICYHFVIDTSKYPCCKWQASRLLVLHPKRFAYARKFLIAYNIVECIWFFFLIFFLLKYYKFYLHPRFKILTEIGVTRLSCIHPGHHHYDTKNWAQYFCEKTWR